MNAFGQRRLATAKVEAPVIPDVPEPQLRALNAGPLADLRALCLARVDKDRWAAPCLMLLTAPNRCYVKSYCRFSHPASGTIRCLGADML